MKIANITKTWIVLLMYLLAGMAGTESLVLCLGTQGHIEIKPLNESCEKLPDVFSNADFQASIADPARPATNFCGPCVDIPILAGSSGQQSQQLRHSEDFSQQDHHVALITSTSAIAFSTETLGKDLLSSPNSTINSTITSLKTIIFLV